MRYAHLISAIYGEPWAIRPEYGAVIDTIMQRAVRGDRLSDDELRAAIGDAPAQAAQRRDGDRAAGGNGVAVVPVFGVISHRAHQVQNISGPGGTSTELLGRQIDTLLADESVGAIVLDIDSPGGSVHGVEELADKIYAARDKKAIVAVANATAASAAYWIGAAASELVVTPGGEAGSIGVWGMHIDYSKNNEMVGVKPTYISAGKYKIEGNPDSPLDDEARGYMQVRVDEYYDAFAAAVARFRGASPADVRNGYGEGRTLGAAAAVKAGMADRIETLDQTIARLKRPGAATRLVNRQRAELDLLELT